MDNGFFSFVATMGIVFALIMLVANAGVLYKCGNYERMSGRNATFVPFDTCYVEGDDGVNYRWDEWKLRNAAVGTDDG